MSRIDHGPGDFAVVLGTEDGQTVMALHGVLDGVTAPDLAQYLDAVIVVRPDDVVLDLAELESIDMSGLRVVLEAQTRLHVDGRELVLRSPSLLVRNTLATWGVVASDDLRTR